MIVICITFLLFKKAEGWTGIFKQEVDLIKCVWVEYKMVILVENKGDIMVENKGDLMLEYKWDILKEGEVIIVEQKYGEVDTVTKG